MTIRTIYGDLSKVSEIQAPQVSARVLEDRYGVFYVQYEFSRDNDQWRFHTGNGDDMSHPSTYGTKAAARVAARNIVNRNNPK